MMKPVILRADGWAGKAGVGSQQNQARNEQEYAESLLTSQGNLKPLSFIATEQKD